MKIKATMKDVAVFMGVIVVGYLFSMGVLYAAFRIFFPIVVEKEELTMKNIRLDNGNTVMKVSREGRTSKQAARLHKIKLAHG
jgi:hypothetical protein